jgi:alkylated DNA repair dioxygenase AlkB
MTSALGGARRDLGDGAWVALLEGFVADDHVVMERLRATLPLGAQTIRLAGREVQSPRLVSWHGDPDAYYRYSGRTFAPHPWTPELLALKAPLDAAVGVAFNSVLANYYRDGRDSMGEHADDEPELGPTRDNVIIAFLLRDRRRRVVEELALGEGSLLVMGGTTQRHFTHRVPRTSEAVGPRMNLTFRVVVGRR